MIDGPWTWQYGPKRCAACWLTATCASRCGLKDSNGPDGLPGRRQRAALYRRTRKLIGCRVSHVEERDEDERMTDYTARKAYQDPVVAATYEEQRFSTPRGRMVHLLELRAVRKALAYAEPVASVLDLPCGTARIMYPLADGNLSMFGADISWEMLQQARAKMVNLYETARPTRLVRCDAERLPFSDGVFDCVISLRFMGHLPPEIRKSVLREMKRVSRHWLIVAFYISDPVFQLKRALRRAMSKPYSAFPATWGGLKQELSSAGLSPIRVLPVAPLHLSETHILLLSVQ